MTAANVLRRGPGRILWLILGVSLAIHVLCLVAARTWLQGWHWKQDPVHASVEMAGGMIALGVAWMLLSLERLRAGTSYNVWIAGALVGMGILDGMHALVYAGQPFVWLHSTATVAGGLLFAMVWLPPDWQRRAFWWPWVVLGGAISFGVVSMQFPDLTPRMVIDDKFTIWAKGLNIAGGVLLFAAAVRLVMTYRRTGNIDDLLFCLHCALFGSAAIMFEQSELWDLPWWGWHLLRLMAYGVALWFVVETDLRTAMQLRERAATKARVAALEENAAELQAQRAAALELAEQAERARRQAESANQALERSNADLQQFAYVASHDLQEPLRAVSGYCQLLDSKLGEHGDEQVRLFLGHATDGAKRMQGLINSLLDYARVESRGKNFEPVDMNETLRAALANLQVAIQESSAEVVADGLPKIRGDREQLIRLLQNLIGNAIKFRSDEAPRVCVEVQENSGDWMFSVSDNGIGIDPKYAERIFVIFQRLHTRTEFPGTGLGLAITKRIVERHGGRIWMESAVGQGSKFLFTIAKASA